MSLICVFAYGSNMDPADYRQWCETNNRRHTAWDEAEVARLPGFRLSFDYRSRSRGGGTANVLPDADSSVFGLVLRVSAYDFASLDLKEGHPLTYERSLQPLVLESGAKQDAWVYHVHPTRRSATHIPPTPYYLGLIRSAAEKHAFPQAYRDHLASIPTVG